MVEREKAVDKLRSFLRELARRNAKLEEFATGNLNYLKPRVRRWLKEGIEFPLNEVLTETEERMVRFYSGLDGEDKMHSLAATARFLGRSSESRDLIAATLRYCWIKLKRRELVGPEAVETLKLPGLIYNRLVEMEVIKIDDIPNLSDGQIRAICGSEWGLSILKEVMQKRGIDWDHKVKSPLLATKRKGY